MNTCFVIQPFDNDVYDKRYRDVFEPAIKASELEPYRVDQDPAASIPIEEIEAGIRRAAVVFAEISTDNPNVWFELGFAIASGKEVVMVCSDSRAGRFPFDVQHRSVVKYGTESTSDFVEFAERLQARLAAAVSKRDLSSIGAVAAFTTQEGLSQHETVGLVAIAQGLDSPTDFVSAYSVRKDMENAGFTPVAFTMAMAALIRKGFVETTRANDSDYAGGGEFTAYLMLDKGFEWLEKNIEHLVLHQEKAAPAQDDFAGIDFGGDDIPF